MINNVRAPFAPARYILLFAMCLVFIPAFAGSASAQTPQSAVTVTSHACPPGYSDLADCTPIGGVSVRVLQDGQQLADVTTTEGAPSPVEVMWGARIEVQYLAGAPTGSTLESAPAPFDAVEGANAVSLVFILEDADDADGDGLSDEDEDVHGTDPNDPDSDDDGVLDGGEVNAGTDPLDEDSDDDGFIDFVELERGSDPLDPDSVPAETEPNAVSVTLYTCPTGYDGKDHWADCREPAEGVDLIFALWASEYAVTATTDTAGIVRYTDLGAGEFRLIMEPEDLGFDLERSFLHCNGEPASPDGPEPRQVTLTPVDATSYGMELTAGEDITCTWFAIPAGDDGVSTPTAPVKRLPSTGTGPAVIPGVDGAVLLSAAIAGVALLAAASAYITRRRT